MSFAWVSDPTALMTLATLVVMEVVLGIDNLIFISILTNKLPEHQRAVQKGTDREPKDHGRASRQCHHRRPFRNRPDGLPWHK